LKEIKEKAKTLREKFKAGESLPIADLIKHRQEAEKERKEKVDELAKKRKEKLKEG